MARIFLRFVYRCKQSHSIDQTVVIGPSLDKAAIGRMGIFEKPIRTKVRLDRNDPAFEFRFKKSKSRSKEKKRLGSKIPLLATEPCIELAFAAAPMNHGAE